MGDVGSAFLGYTFAVLPLMALKESPPQARLFPLVGITLLSLFVFDGMITLLKRIARMEKVWHAHREHIYQKLVISGFSHRVVTGIYAVLSIFTLLLLIFWLRSESSFKDFVFVIVVFQLICLFIYSYVRKH
jgi:UDP-N-acetylmuramyl pentapeptide phosphotransferase/UDP-N-acetylglucosamine-1-phosphate transferase